MRIILYYKFYMIIIIYIKNRNLYNIMDNENHNNNFNQGMNNIFQVQNNMFNFNNKDNKNKNNKSIFALAGNNIMNNHNNKNQNQNKFLNMENNNMNIIQGNICKDNNINNHLQNLNNQENINSNNNTIYNNYIIDNMMNNDDVMSNNNFQKNMNNNNMINNIDFKNFMTFMNNMNNNMNNNLNNNNNNINNLIYNFMNNNNNMINNLKNNNMNNNNNMLNNLNYNNKMHNNLKNNIMNNNNINNNNNNKFNIMNNNNINNNNNNNKFNIMTNNNINNNHFMFNNWNNNIMNNNNNVNNNNLLNNNMNNNNANNNNNIMNNIMNNDNNNMMDNIMSNIMINNNINNNSMNMMDINNIYNFSFSNILCEVIWIHKNILKELNNAFISFLSQRNLKFTEVSDANSCIEIMKSDKFEYKCIYVVVSGSMFLEFIEYFNNNLSEIKCIPIITIFTLDKEKYQNLQYANHPFYNPGGIHVEYMELVQAFLKFDSIVKTKIKTNIIPPVKKNDCFNFETIDSIPKFYFPFIYSKLIVKIKDEDINEFNNNILKYNNEEISKLIYPLTFLKEIPIQLLVKFWLRIYTLETDFYSNMNCKLMKFEGKEFYTYIKLLYFAINQEYVKNRCDIRLYRGDIMNNEELNIIKKKSKSDLLIDKLIFGRRFQSFSTSQNVAETFIIDKYSRKGLSTNYILYKINPFNGDIKDAKCYNIDVKEFAKYQEEEEYLFLPYSPFVLESIKQISIPIGNNLDILTNLIELSYIGIYKDIIKTSMKNISSLDDISFDLLKKSFLDEIEKYKIFDNEENIWDKIKNIIKKIDI